MARAAAGQLVDAAPAFEGMLRNRLADAVREFPGHVRNQPEVKRQQAVASLHFNSGAREGTCAAIR